MEKQETLSKDEKQETLSKVSLLQEQKDASPARKKIEEFMTTADDTIPDFKNLDSALRQQVAQEFMNNPQAIKKLKKIKDALSEQATNYFKEYQEIHEDMKSSVDWNTFQGVGGFFIKSAAGFAGMGPWARMEEAEKKWKDCRQKADNILSEVFGPDAPKGLKLD